MDHPPPRPSLIDRTRSRARALWVRLRDEHATPREIGWAVFAGVIAGCTPAIGFHGAVAIGLALVFRLNKVWTWLGSRVSNVFVLPWIVYAEIELAHRVRTGAWLTLSIDGVLDQGHLLMADWLLGTLPVGAALGAVCGAAAYAIATWRVRVRRGGRRAPPPPPSSGSPP